MTMALMDYLSYIDRTVIEVTYNNCVHENFLLILCVENAVVMFVASCYIKINFFFAIQLYVQIGLALFEWNSKGLLLCDNKWEIHKVVHK